MTVEVVWHGPRVLTKVRQVCIPVALLRALDLDAGSQLQFALDETQGEIRIRRAGGPRTTQDAKDDHEP